MRTLRRWHDQSSEAASEHLRPGPSKNRLRLRVPFEHSPGIVNLDESVERRIDNAARHLRTFGQRLLRLATLGDVTSNLGKTDQLAGAATDRVDDDACPETFTVLAHPPTFPLESALPRGDRQRPLRQAARAILGRIEEGEMLTDDLVCPITRNPPCARVPVADDTVRVEHADRIIRNALDEQTEAALSLLQLRKRLLHLLCALLDSLLQGFVELLQQLLGLFAVGEVLQHVHGTDQLPRGVMQRRRIGHDRNASAVGALPKDLLTPD